MRHTPRVAILALLAVFAVTACSTSTDTPAPATSTTSAALAKVKLGEVDAALVYRTDAKSSSSDVDGIEFPESAKAINDYPIAVLSKAPNKPAAQAFVAYVLSDKGIAVLTNVGFQKP